MPSVIDEQTQFLDQNTGIPIVNGKVYIGLQNNDPKANLITIYSNRNLSVILANPQSTDSSGRTVNKIWVPGKYSIQVDNSNDVQKYQELDNGELRGTGISLLTNVQGTNTITAEGAPAISALIDNQAYIFQAVAANIGPVTLQIDLTPAQPVRKLHDQELLADDFQAGQVVLVAHNETDQVYELLSNTTSATFISLRTNDLIFPATQVPSVDPNALDDYEEGTWTPSLGGTSTATIAAGSYTKTGQLVQVSMRLANITIGTGSTTAISGLPFTVETVSGAHYPLAIGTWTNLVPADIFSLHFTINSGTTINGEVQTTSAGFPSTSALFQNGSSISLSGVYVAA